MTIEASADSAAIVSARSRPRLWRRYCYVLLMAAWMGGFTFYALIVIPTAERVLDSMRDTGFITQQVTRWLNLVGLGVLVLLPALVSGGWKTISRRLRTGVVATWALMAAAQVGLFVTHPLMDQLLEAQGHKLHRYDHFVVLHTVYLCFATTQWCAALIQIWLMLMVWRRQDEKP